MPDGYVAYLGDASTATIADAYRLPQRELDISIADGHLLWHVGKRRLDVSLVALREANLGTATFGSEEFLAFSLLFGAPDAGGPMGGPILLNSFDDVGWFEEFVESMRELLPCPVHNRAKRS
jgi:hypothetical protein